MHYLNYSAISLILVLLAVGLQPICGIVNPVFFIEGTGWQNQTHGGYIGHFKIPIKVELNGWWIALIYDQPIAEIEAWQGINFKTSADRKILYLKQITWNKRQYPGMVMDQRFLVNFKKSPGVNYDEHYGPRPKIVFLDKVYVPDPQNNNEHPMTVIDLNEFSLPSNFEILPVNVVTTPVSVTTTTRPLTPGPNAGLFWWVQTQATLAKVLPQKLTTTPTPPTTTTLLTTTTLPQFTVSCTKYANFKKAKCKREKIPSNRCFVPQCSSNDVSQFRVIQCWKRLGSCWCVNPHTGLRNKLLPIIRYKNVYKLNCFAASAATTTTPQPKATTFKATLPTRPPNSAPLKRPIFAPRNNYAYSLVLHNSLLFYEAQRSGNIGSSGRVFWRRSSHLNDGSNCKYDLSGGYYVSGDYVKYGFPTAAAMTILSWGFLEFPDAYEQTKQTHFLKQALKWGADYFMKAHVSRNVLIGQVGNSDLENSFWERPQDMKVKRPCYSVTVRNPGSDLAGETAAALAATAKVWLRTGSNTNNPYVIKLLRHARELYEFAVTYRGVYSYSIRPALKHYASTSYGDELAWAALWLYEATGETKYLADASRFYDEFNLDAAEGEFSWDNKAVGVQLLLSKHTHNIGSVNKAQKYLSRVTAFCNHNRPGGSATFTPQGLLFMNGWGTTRYACNAAFVCIVASQLPALDTNLKLTFRQFAESQIDYVLGKTGRSYVIGYGRVFPSKPHHRASSCNTFGNCGWTAYHSNSTNPQILFGALVGGPDDKDSYDDSRSNFKSNSVGLDYNAGFQGAVAGLKHYQIQYNDWMKYTLQPTG